MVRREDIIGMDQNENIMKEILEAITDLNKTRLAENLRHSLITRRKKTTLRIKNIPAIRRGSR